MNALLAPLRQIARDLVEKKLWPLAVLLLVAIVAVPIVIGTSSQDAPAPAPVASATPAAPGAVGGKSLITVVDQAVTGKDDRPGKIDDPFYDPPAPPAADTASGGGASPSDSTGGTTPTDDKTPTETTPSEPAAPATAPVYYRTEVRWYEASRGKPHPISRLTPLGGLVDTAALYLGVTKSSGNYAVFLLGANATSDGEGSCEDEPDCRVVGLKTGQTQIVTVQPPDGSEARQYSLEVVSVKAVTTSAAEARKMRAKVHPDGRDVMREMWQNAPTAAALGPIQYDHTTGLLYKTSATGVAKASN